MYEFTNFTYYKSTVIERHNEIPSITLLECSIGHINVMINQHYTEHAGGESFLWPSQMTFFKLSPIDSFSLVYDYVNFVLGMLMYFP